MPQESTIDEIMQTYIEAWKLGLKAIAIYRDGSKRTQPLNTLSADSVEGLAGVTPVQRKMPEERQALTHKFKIAGHEGYITVGMYDDGSPGEIFINMSKEGSTVSGLMDAFARAISYALQYGVPLEVLVNKFSHTRFEPSGFTGNPDIPYAKSITDYIFRWLASKFLSAEMSAQMGVMPDNGKNSETAGAASEKASKAKPTLTDGISVSTPLFEDAPPCSVCGSIMVRNGSCYKCLNCGTTSGCS
jgi:ribonucleoside-diphosphate reductase alpha chain